MFTSAQFPEFQQSVLKYLSLLEAKQAYAVVGMTTTLARTESFNIQILRAHLNSSSGSSNSISVIALHPSVAILIRVRVQIYFFV